MHASKQTVSIRAVSNDPIRPTPDNPKCILCGIGPVQDRDMMGWERERRYQIRNSKSKIRNIEEAPSKSEIRNPKSPISDPRSPIYTELGRKTGAG